MPEEFGWAPVDDKEVGRLFYHNSVTKVRSVLSLVLQGTNQACSRSLTAPDLPAGISMGEARDPGLAENCHAQGRPVNPFSHAPSWEAVQALNAFLVLHSAGLAFLKFRLIIKVGPLSFEEVRNKGCTIRCEIL